MPALKIKTCAKPPAKKFPRPWHILIIVAVAAVIAFSGAYLLNGGFGEDAFAFVPSKSSSESSSQASAPFESSPTSGGSSSKPSLPAQNSSESSSSASEAPSSSSESPQSSESSEPSGGGGYEYPEPGPSSIEPVPESPRVTNSYFDDAMFVGDSITHGILAYEIMQNTTVVAQTGINIDNIRYKKAFRLSDGTLVTALEAMARHKDAKKIYIMLGSNGVEWMSENTFIGCYEDFLDAVIKQHPDAIIYLQSMLPVTPSLSNNKSRDITNRKIDWYNWLIMELAAKKGVNYLDVNSALKDETGALPESASPSDGMHFTTKYYIQWFDYLKAHTVQE